MFVGYFNKTDDFSRRNQVGILLREIGHTLGMKYGNDGCNYTIPGVIWIMGSPVSDRPGKLQWSNCSIEVVQKWRSTYFCLQEKIKPPKPSCRNGVLEEGEQCECVSEVCQNCCNDKCQLTDGSECSSGPCCDKETCKPRTKDEKYRCRKAKDSCDILEMCSGKTNKCPSNYVVADGYECRDSPDRAYCFEGMCGSRKDVCSWVFVNGKVGEESCYEQNLKNGSDFGCGPTFMDHQKFPNFACEKKDIRCGKIFCDQYGFDTEDYAIALWIDRIRAKPVSGTNCSFLRLGSNSRSLREDPTFVQNGSECGSENMCVKQKCVSLPAGCPKNCPGKKVQHPDTHELLPAYILPDPDAESDDKIDYKPDALQWLYIIFSVLAILLVLAILVYRSTNNSRIQPEQPEVQIKLDQESSILHEPEENTDIPNKLESENH
ncbi:disintegrin and metalloproteinase domain-containing protein adm-2-like [Brevipalpus obovatus]|uniref:disintegrin and metalloproteinase domain-containing protein adm-2-like n=1 Tax=Brevipalpus obovatus TaxID=246614 RepID=UPI003D9EE5B5